MSRSQYTDQDECTQNPYCSLPVQISLRPLGSMWQGQYKHWGMAIDFKRWWPSDMLRHQRVGRLWGNVSEGSVPHGFGSLNDFQPTIKSTHAFHAGLLACPLSILYLGKCPSFITSSGLISHLSPPTAFPCAGPVTASVHFLASLPPSLFSLRRILSRSIAEHGPSSLLRSKNQRIFTVLSLRFDQGV